MTYFYLPEENVVLREDDTKTQGFIVSTSKEDVFGYKTEIVKPVENAQEITAEQYILALEESLVGIQWDRDVYRNIFEQNNDTIQ